MASKIVLAVSMNPEEKEAIVEAAKREGRTASGYVRHVVMREIRKDEVK